MYDPLSNACGGKFKKSIEKMRALAKSKGGYCLSNNYVNQDTPK